MMDSPLLKLWPYQLCACRTHTATTSTAYTAYTATTKNLLLRCTINILYFNNFIFLRPDNLNVILARQNELPEDDILNMKYVIRN